MFKLFTTIIKLYKKNKYQRNFLLNEQLKFNYNSHFVKLIIAITSITKKMNEGKIKRV